MSFHPLQSLPAGQRSSMAFSSSSAHRTASEIADRVAGTLFPPSNGDSFRAAKIAAAMSRTRLRPSSIPAYYSFRLFFAMHFARYLTIQADASTRVRHALLLATVGKLMSSSKDVQESGSALAFNCVDFMISGIRSRRFRTSSSQASLWRSLRLQS
jgi:hypothetical protein